MPAKTDGIHKDNIIKRGSALHASMLGLRKVTKAEGDSLELQYKDWTMQDRLRFGRFARPEYLQAVLEDRVSQLTSPNEKIQTTDRRKPGYHQPMFDPHVENTDAPTKEDIQKALDVLERAKALMP